MRKNIRRGSQLGTLAIEDVDLSAKSRHQLPKLLKALQYIYCHPTLKNAVLDILEKKVNGRLKNTKVGRPGMSLWEIFVLALVRLNLNIDYDNLLDLGNFHTNIRGISGVSNLSDLNAKVVYKLQTLKDNVGLLDEACLMEISELVVKEGHQIIHKKQEQEGLLDETDGSFVLNIKVDSFVVLSNVHFPTDINLLWDCARKTLDSIAKIVADQPIKGLREYRGLITKIKNAYRNASEIHRKKGNDYMNRLQISCQNYLSLAGELTAKLAEAAPYLKAYAAADIKQALLVEQLYYYLTLLKKHIDLVRRRILEGETIPHKDKMFSIFETYTELLKKGKPNNLIEFGLNTNIASCQYGFITLHKVMVGEVDVDMTIPTASGIAIKFTKAENYRLNRISYDGNYYSSTAKQKVQGIFSEVIIPKKGKKNTADKQEESAEDFKKGRREHSAVESNINSLEHHGLDRCPDRSLAHFKRYVALGVLSYNLTLLGGLL